MYLELGGKEMGAPGCFYLVLFFLLEPLMDHADLAIHKGVFKSLSLPHGINDKQKVCISSCIRNNSQFPAVPISFQHSKGEKKYNNICPEHNILDKEPYMVTSVGLLLPTKIN